MDNNTKQNITVVHSVSEYVTEVLSTSTENDDGSHNMHYFRGQTDKTWELSPSLSRIPYYKNDNTIEKELIECAKNVMPEEYADPSLTPVEILTLLQHSGIPTRLLDITENPLVALYFATVDPNGDLCDFTDGEVIQFRDRQSTEYVTPWENAIADSCYLFDKNRNYSRFIESAIDKAYFEGYREKDDIDNEDVVKSKCSKPLFITSKAHLERQSNQKGHYILFPNEEGTDGFTPDIPSLSKENECVERRYIIPKEDKDRIFHDLDRLGISESTVYPDSIDHICRDIVRKTKQKFDTGIRKPHMPNRKTNNDG